MDTEETALIGRLVRVVRSDADSREVYGRLFDGQFLRCTLRQGDLPKRGDTILLADDDWEYAPDDIWPSAQAIAVVRRILPDGDVLIDDGLQLRLIRNDRDVSVALHNTVEFNEAEGVIRVLAQTPVRSRDYGLDVEDVRKEYLVDTSGAGPTFADFGGYPAVVTRARELIDTQILYHNELQRIGARPVKGILFTGPPGTGKTHLARIIAHHSEAEFFLVSGPSVVSKWLGDSEDTLRKIFDAAAGSESGHAIIFFDEIDSIAERRTGESHEASKRLVAQLLTLMDGFDERPGNIIVIASTNRVETLDPALTRPGRFDWEIEFGMPTIDDRYDILQVGVKNLQTSGTLPLADVAAVTVGWSAAELSSIWAEAALLAASEKRDRITAEDVARAYERVAHRPRHQNEVRPL
jgi:transitional endoplasmic reticulum ATPase